MTHTQIPVSCSSSSVLVLRILAHCRSIMVYWNTLTEQRHRYNVISHTCTYFLRRQSTIVRTPEGTSNESGLPWLRGAFETAGEMTWLSIKSSGSGLQRGVKNAAIKRNYR